MDMGKHRILVVDDEPKVAFFFQKNLEMVDSSYLAKAVNSGREALVELQKEHYDLLITDLRMPQMNGLELLEQVRRLSPQTKTILVTAYGSEEVWQDAYRLKAFRALSKPLKIPDLLAAVNEALAEPIHPSAGLLALTGERFEALAGRIEKLRVDLGARAALLADLSGQLLVYGGNIEKLDTATMMALLGGNMAASSELGRYLNYPSPVYLAFFEGPPYDLYAASIGHHFFLTLVFDRHPGTAGTSRIGMVWLYTRRALEELQVLLGQAEFEAGTGTQAVAGEEFADALQLELDGLFSAGPTTVAAPSKPAKTRTASAGPAGQPAGLPAGLAGQVNNLLAIFGRQTGIATESRLDSLVVPLTEPAAALTVRAVSTVLKNVYQQAEATIVGVNFKHDAQWLYGCVADNGNGLNNQPGRLAANLVSLQQQFQQFGGELQVSGRPGIGTTVEFKLPHSKS